MAEEAKDAPVALDAVKLVEPLTKQELEVAIMRGWNMAFAAEVQTLLPAKLPGCTFKVFSYTRTSDIDVNIDWPGMPSSICYRIQKTALFEGSLKAFGSHLAIDDVHVKQIQESLCKQYFDKRAPDIVTFLCVVVHTLVGLARIKQCSLSTTAASQS